MKRINFRIQNRIREWARRSKTRGAEKLGLILQVLQAGSIVAGGIYFLIQYQENIVSGRKQETMKFAEKFLDRALTGTDNDFDKAFQDPDVKPAFDKALRNSVASSDICEVKTAYNQYLIAPIAKTAEERGQFYSKLSFRLRALETISTCVNSEACDLDTACGFFFDEALALVSNYCIELDRYRIQFGESPARETEAFLERCSKSSTFSREVKSLTYCDIIRTKYAARHDLQKKPVRLQLTEMYKTCPFVR